MASEELAKKLQSRLAAAEEVEQRPESEQSPVPAQSLEPDHACGDTPSELATKLNRRLDINDGNAPSRATLVFNPYTEFKEFSRKQIKDMEAMFKRYDTGKDGFIDLMELKLMMEKLGAPQTHLGLKNMIKEVDEDFDGKLSFREVRWGLCTGEFTEEQGVLRSPDGRSVLPEMEWEREQAKQVFQRSTDEQNFSANCVRWGKLKFGKEETLGALWPGAAGFSWVTSMVCGGHKGESSYELIKNKVC
ncbi:hypothetical protein GOODEAATRI_018225 [Goodea atripinnis]|uniref:EF-hand domain-containing protein n=1 Tax=Goodea atripinnis TaxID=208336 RepID=A0ABV0NWY5_9TELE